MATVNQLAKTQYNGMILLSSYLQRLFVQQSIALQLGDVKDEAKINKYKNLHDDLFLIIPLFEQTKVLTENQIQKLLSIYENTNEDFQSFFTTEPCSLSEKVAIIAASFYGERHLNEKIIHLSQLFDAEIGRDYEKRIDFYNERIKLMDYVVLALKKGDKLKPELLQQLEVWYRNITSIKQHVVEDLTKVPQLLVVN